MTGLEIALLVLGGIVFVLSFVIPVRQEEASEEVRGLVQREVRSKVGEEMDRIRGHVDDVVDEAIEYAQEKTERSLERLSNEKIMAVNEYSDTVLEEINKNHKEVMFLYDMLSDKQESLRDAVSEATQTVREVEEATREAEEAQKAREAAQAQRTQAAPDAGSGALASPGGSQDGSVPADAAAEDSARDGFQPIFARQGADASASGRKEPKIRTLDWAALAEAEAGDGPGEDGDAPAAKPEPAGPQEQLRDRILALNRLGISSVQIAKQLGIGVGEVELIIGLHGSKGNEG